MSTLLCRVAIKRTSCKLISVLHGAPNTSKLIIKARDKCETVYNPFLKYIYHAIMYLKEELVKLAFVIIVAIVKNMFFFHLILSSR